MKRLLDTNIVSFLFKQDSRIMAYKPYLDDQVWAISLMTLAELYHWAKSRQWGDKRLQELEIWLFENFEIIVFDLETCRWWGEITALRRAKGQPISAQDAWIAATALQHQLALVTHNPADFEHLVDLEIITTVY